MCHNLQILRLSQSTITQLSIGHIVNLCSNDVQRFDTVRIPILCLSMFILIFQNFEFINELWVVPLFTPVVIYLLWREIGPSCLAALAIIVLQPPLQFVLARLVAKWRYVLQYYTVYMELCSYCWGVRLLSRCMLTVEVYAYCWGVCLLLRCPQPVTGPLHVHVWFMICKIMFRNESPKMFTDYSISVFLCLLFYLSNGIIGAFASIILGIINACFVYLSKLIILVINKLLVGRSSTFNFNNIIVLYYFVL